MRKLRLQIVVVMVGVAWTLAAGSKARAEIPGEKDVEGYTDAKYRADLLALNRKTIVEAYANVGKHNPAWDAKATAFLEAMAQQFTYGSCTYFYDYPQLARPTELAALGKAAVDAGCDDPLVLYLYTRALVLSYSAEPLEPYYVKMTPAMLESKYPPIRVSRAISIAAAGLSSPQNKELRERCLKAIPDLLDAALATKAIEDLGPAGPRFGVEFMDSPKEAMAELDFYDRALAFSADGLKKGLHPYIMKCMAGRAYLGKTKGVFWAPGSPQAANKQAEGARLFAAARHELADAYQAYPQFPTAPAMMVLTILQEVAHNKADVRPWFERATKAQFDYELAYINYGVSLRPDAGGSSEEMRDFADECANTGRFDTFVPYLYLQIMDRRAVSDSQALPEKSDEILATTAKVMEGYAQSYHQPYRLNTINSHRCALAAAAKNKTDVCTYAKKLGDNVEAAPFDRLGLIPSTEIQAAQALTSSHDVRIADADANAAQTPDEALERFQAVLGNVAETDPSRAYVLGRIAKIKAEKDFAAGDWVDIQPKADLAGWAPNGGKWSVDKEGGLVGECGQEALEILHVGHFGRRFTLSGRIEVLRGPSGVKPKARPSVFVLASPGNLRAVMQIYQEPAQVVLAECYWTGERVPVTRYVYPTATTGKDDFSISVWDNHIYCTVNGQGVGRRLKVSDEAGTPLPLIGLGTPKMNDGAIYRYSNLKIRRLDREPATQTPAVEENQ